MSDHTEEERLGDQANTQTKNPSDEFVPTEDTVSNKPNQEAEHMEVHHHAHQAEKKNWKSYFWEFLMLFLAVFCGFLAEYQLEHKIEKEKETVLSVSFLTELRVC